MAYRRKAFPAAAFVRHIAFLDPLLCGSLIDAAVWKVWYGEPGLAHTLFAHSKFPGPKAEELSLLDSTKLLANALGEHLALTYRRAFGSREPRYAEVIDEAARLTIERIGGSDALYHDTQHTALVVLVAQDTLRGRLISNAVSPEDWLHTILAALYHDIGYVRGVCGGDHDGRFVCDAEGNTVTLPRGASDAALAPYHVERSKIAVRERFGNHDLVDSERIDRAIELTRFPVPEDNDHAETDTEAGLTRAADLIGQLGDPLYPRKLNALFHEFARDRSKRAARLLQSGRLGRAVSHFLLVQGRAVYR